jgi:hypothetical protein
VTADRWRWRTVPELSPAAGVPANAKLNAAAAADDLLRHSRITGPAVLVLGDDEVAATAASVAHRLGGRPTVLLGKSPLKGPFAAKDEAHARALLASDASSGRADVVLSADGNLEEAASLVRRGGQIGTLAPTVSLPSLTTMVQRELVILAVRDRVQGALGCDLSWWRET